MRGLDPRRKMDTRPPLRSQAPRTLTKCSSGYQQFGAPRLSLACLDSEALFAQEWECHWQGQSYPDIYFCVVPRTWTTCAGGKPSHEGFMLLVASARSDLCQVYTEQQRAAPAAQRHIKRSDDCKPGMAHSSGLSRSVPGLNENLHMLSTLRGARHAKSPKSENLNRRLIVASQLSIQIPVLPSAKGS